jgi:hypothetical protein
MLSTQVQPSASYQINMLNPDAIIHPQYEKFHPYYKVDKDFNQDYSIYKQKANSNNSYQLLDDMGNAHMNYRVPIGYVGDQNYKTFMSDHSVAFMSKMITKYLQGVHPEGKNIIVPETTIRSVADSVFVNDINDAGTMQQMCISLIVNKIKEEYEQINQNNKLSIWVQNYDGAYGIKQFNGVKLNNLGLNNWNATMQWRY